MHLILYNPYTFLFDNFHEKEYSSVIVTNYLVPHSFAHYLL